MQARSRAPDGIWERTSLTIERGSFDLPGIRREALPFTARKPVMILQVRISVLRHNTAGFAPSVSSGEDLHSSGLT
jgi:hypothetical protein